MDPITVVLFGWHSKKQSAAADDSLFNPLQPYFEPEIVSVEWLDKIDVASLGDPSQPIVFFFAHPPFKQVADLKRNVIWIPMWDMARYYPPSFWASIPPNVHIISFADAVSRVTRPAGLKTLDVRFFRDPASLPPAPWTGERVALYWNRVGLVSARFLARWCAAIKADRLLFKPHTDPYTHPSLRFTLPDHLGATAVEIVPHTESREDYFRLTERANIFLAPRQHEGIGMAFIEALARGCAVFAFDGETMNEYIRSGETGYLLTHQTSEFARRLWRYRRKLRRLHIRDPWPTYMLRDDQPWEEMAVLDLPALGRAARAEQEAGYRRWQADIPKMVEFIRDSARI